MARRRTTRLRWQLVAALAVLGCIPTHQIIRAPLTGMVLDAHSHAPLAGVHVTAESYYLEAKDVQHLVAKAETDTTADGRWSLPMERSPHLTFAVILCVPVDTWPPATRLRFERPGYPTFTVDDALPGIARAVSKGEPIALAPMTGSSRRTP